MTTSPSLQRTSAWTTLAVAIVVVVVLPWLPFANLIVRPLVWLSTLAHEGGHGVAAVLVGGRFTSLQVFADASGVATSSWSNSTPLNSAIVSAGGLLGPSIAALALLWLGVTARTARFGLVVAALVCAVAVATVTNGFATVVTAGWGFVFAAIAAKASSSTARLAILVLAVELQATVFSRADYLFVAEAHTGAGVMPSDVQQIANALGGHHLAWGMGIAFVSTALFVVGAVGFMYGDRLTSWWARRQTMKATTTKKTKP